MSNGIRKFVEIDGVHQCVVVDMTSPPCSDDKMLRRKTEPVFSMLDMMRFARYMADGKRSEADLKRIFYHWTQDRFKWIEG